MGAFVGAFVGLDVGAFVGAFVGLDVGAFVGFEVGATVGHLKQNSIRRIACPSPVPRFSPVAPAPSSYSYRSYRVAKESPLTMTAVLGVLAYAMMSAKRNAL